MRKVRTMLVCASAGRQAVGWKGERDGKKSQGWQLGVYSLGLWRQEAGGQRQVVDSQDNCIAESSKGLWQGSLGI